MKEQAEMFEQSDIDERQFELLIQLADDELPQDLPEYAEAQAMLAQPAARTVYDNIRYSQEMLRESVLGEAAAAALDVDLTMLRGRVMSKLPSAPRAAVVEAAATPGWLDWLRAFGFGRAGLAAAALTIAAVWWAGAQPGTAPQLPREPAAMAREDATMPPGHEDEPAVIIEEMDVEDGSIAVNPGDHPGESTVIWHFTGKGEG